MVKCEICHKYRAIFKIRETDTNTIRYTCDWCEKPNQELLEILDLDEEDKNNKTPEYGRLHFVKSTRLPSVCRECKNIMPVGSECYNQAIHTLPFPTPSKLCLTCAKLQIVKGVKIA